MKTQRRKGRTIQPPSRPKRPSNPHVLAARNELRKMLRVCRTQRTRTLREFCEAEIIIPTGPFANRKFKVERQPFTGPLLDAMYGAWQVTVITGPQQSGKSLIAFVVPILYHLFEMNETVICALPDINMAGDKWERDILPVLEKTRYAKLLPDRGEGSRGGKVKNSITFKNGAVLKFMSAGGSDKSRAAFNARVVVGTEANAFGRSSENSEEANMIDQIMGRTRSYGANRKIYLECTLETEACLIWQKYISGTASFFVAQCPWCNEWVSPDREQLRGHQLAENVIDAREAAYFECPACGGEIDDELRKKMNATLRLLHRGQKIDENGDVVGDVPKTDTLGLRWTGFNNLFNKCGDFAAEEWQALREIDEDSAERRLCQFLWCRPFKPPHEEAAELDANVLIHRMDRIARGIVPDWAQVVTIGTDLGKRIGHYVVIAWAQGFTGHIVDYGRFDIPSDSFGVEQATLTALREFRDGYCKTGWRSPAGRHWLPEQVWIDSNYQSDVVCEFIRETHRRDPKRFRPTRGYGAGQLRGQRYNAPKKRTTEITAVGEGYHFVRDFEKRVTRVDVDANHWKSFFHGRLACGFVDDQGNRIHGGIHDADGKRMVGSLSLFEQPAREHMTIAKHWTAEKQVLEYVPGEGERLVWQRLRQQNHWLDSSTLSAAAAHFCGIRLEPPRQDPPGPSPVDPTPPLTTPDGRPFSVLERE